MLVKKQNNVFIILLTTELCYSTGHDPTSLYQPDINNNSEILKLKCFKIEENKKEENKEENKEDNKEENKEEENKEEIKKKKIKKKIKKK
ncbi:hypothetical protein H8356DRAFT_1436834 [Neocallimastix lanati (nom. inval.)]|nr:hypothetical protein H8356DRAFT_1436834 [Neocallimastix sp. JGI-2020a]